MKHKIFLFVCLISLLCSSCYEDKGNYDYKGLLHVTVTGFVTEKDGKEVSLGFLAIKLGATVKAKPVLSFSEENPAMNLAYTWIFKDKVIGTEKNLIWIPDVVALGTVLLDIEDLDNGNHFRGQFAINIEDPYDGSGFWVLSEKEGSPCVSFLMGAYDSNTEGFEPLIGLYQKENDKTLPSDVFKLHEHYRKHDSYNTQLMAVCKSDFVDINAYTFREENRGAEMFMSGVPRISDVMFMQWVDIVTDEQGRIYKRTKSTNELFHSNRFLPDPVEDENRDVFEGISIIPGDLAKNNCLLYDGKKKRYLIISDWKRDDSQTLGQITVAKSGDGKWPENFTPLDNMDGYNRIYTGYYFYPNGPYYSANQYFSVIEKAGTYYYQHFIIDRNFSTNEAFFDEMTQGEMLGLETIITENSIFSLLRYAEGWDSSIHPYILISSGKSLYLYDTTVKVGTPSGEQVLKLYEFDSPIVAMNGDCISGMHLGVGLENGEFYVLNMPYAKQNLMNKEKLIFWKLPAGQLGAIKYIKYNTMVQAPYY